MPSLKAIKRRITSVKNTQKITRAMKLVAAAKLRRAQDSILAARPYAAALERVVIDLSGHAGSDAHPLLEERDGTRAELVLLTSDRGLAGSFNAQLIRRVEGFVEEELADFTDVSLRVVGRKGHEYFKRRSANIRSFDAAPTSPTALDLAREMSNRVVHDFLEREVDRVYLVYNEFTSAISQTVIAKQILPIVPDATEAAEGSALSGDYHYEPGKDELLGHLLPLHVEIGIYRAALESIASELGARMSAMDSATRNAGEMIDRLTLVYNRARQASITKELLEIISGAEALKG
jgi:F-type H+-transporting ATPase subunit gamma